MNSDLSDIASALTASLARDGQGGMTAVLPLDPTGFSYTNDTNTGMSRSAADTQVITCGGVDVVEISSTGVNIVGDVTQDGYSVGPNVGEIRLYALTTPPSLWALCDGTALTATSPLRTALIAASNPFGVSGSDPLLPYLTNSFPVGAGGTYALGDAGGTTTNTIDQANLPSVSLTTTIASGEGAHTHTVPSGGSQAATYVGGGGGNASFAAAQVTGSATLPAMTGTTPLGGSGTALNNLPPYIGINFIIYVGA